MNRRSRVLLLGLSLFFGSPAYSQERAGKVVINVGSQWNGYEGYVHEMATIILQKWRYVMAGSKTAPPAGTFVAVKFDMGADGRVTDILDVGNTSSEPGAACCLTTIATAAHFSRWTAEMASQLGDSQEITVRFYY